MFSTILVQDMKSTFPGAQSAPESRSRSRAFVLSIAPSSFSYFGCLTNWPILNEILKNISLCYLLAKGAALQCSSSGKSVARGLISNYTTTAMAKVIVYKSCDKLSLLVPYNAKLVFLFYRFLVFSTMFFSSLASLRWGCALDFLDQRQEKAF